MGVYWLLGCHGWRLDIFANCAPSASLSVYLSELVLVEAVVAMMVLRENAFAVERQLAPGVGFPNNFDGEGVV